MIAAAHQLQYLPYTGFFNKMMQSDVFVLVDNVQFQKKEFQNRNRIRTKDGWIWLTVPVLVKGKFYQQIKEVKINNNEKWRKTHLRSVLVNYAKAPYLSDFKGKLEEIYSKERINLVDLNYDFVKFVMDELKIKTKIVIGSEVNISGKKTELLIDICRKTGADTYLSGPGGRNYVDMDMLKQNEIKHFFQEFQHPIYEHHSGKFIPNMCILDILLNKGPDESRKIIIESGGKSGL